MIRLFGWIITHPISSAILALCGFMIVRLIIETINEDPGDRSGG